jgi:hypothetical protein
MVFIMAFTLSGSGRETMFQMRIVCVVCRTGEARAAAQLVSNLRSRKAFPQKRGAAIQNPADPPDRGGDKDANEF